MGRGNSRKRKQIDAVNKRPQVSQPGKPQRWWLQPVSMLIAPVLVIVLGAAVVKYLRFDTPRAKSVSNPVGPVMKIDAAIPERSELENGRTWLFQRPIKLTESDLKQANRLMMKVDLTAYDSWWRERGGVDPDMTNVKVVLRGNSRTGLRILSMTPRVTCGKPLTGALALSPPEADASSAAIGFDLDSPDPIARNVKLNDRLGSPYFSSKTITLKYGETFTVQLRAQTYKKYCEFRIVANVLVGQKQIAVTIDNHGRPFKVSGMPEALFGGDSSGKPGGYSRYQELYIGGAVSPPNGLWHVANPATWHFGM